jgi:catechol-2,3-dioxygenase
MAPRLLGFDHIHVFVQDRAAAEAWYAEVMGLARTPALEFWATGGGPLTLQDADDTIHIALFERPHQENRATVALRVSAEAFAQWRAHLASFPQLKVSAVEDHGVALSLYFRDPDGNPYEITTYEHAAARQAGS